MKKILGISVMILLITTALPVVSSADKNNSSQISNKISVDDECGCNKFYETDDKNGEIFFFNHPVMTELPEPLDPKDASPKPTIIDTPEYFNWMDYNGEDWTTPAKNQGACSSCWDFAALGALESVINIREGCAGLNPDLSEQYVLSCLSDAGSCNGGSTYRAYLYIMSNASSGNNCNGVIPESCMPYQATDTIPCEDKCPDWEELLVPILDYGYWSPNGSPEDIEAIKTQIIQLGPVATCMHSTEDFKIWGRTHHNPDDYYPYPGPDNQHNHVVVIVGWKDDPSIPNGGYWICKNSWGTLWGYEGFFNIEYGSLNIDSCRIIWVDYDPESFDFPPSVEIVNPKKGYFHFLGIPYMPTLLNVVTDAKLLGGYRRLPIQVAAADDTSEMGELMVTLYINNKDKGYGTWNPETRYYEWRVTGWALGIYRLMVIAKDEHGVQSECSTLDVWNFCFLP